MSLWIGDSESDGFKYETTKVWLFVLIDDSTGTFHISFDDSVYQSFDVSNLVAKEVDSYRIYESHQDLLDEANKHTVCMHNYFQHDKPIIKKFWKDWQASGEEDTFILSTLFDPDREIPFGCKGAHGLDAWGARFGLPKPKHEEWDHFSPAMLHRCIEDAKITRRTYDFLSTERKAWDWERAIEGEYKVADIQGRQEMHGIWFDTDTAENLLEKIVNEIVEVTDATMTQAPMHSVIEEPIKGYVCGKKQYTRKSDIPEGKDFERVLGYVDKIYTKAGEYTSVIKRWFGDDYPKFQIGGAFCRVSFAEINLNSDQQVKDMLLSQGWVPTQWNYKKDGKRKVVDADGNYIKTSPKVTEDSFSTIKLGLGQLLAKRSVLMHRQRLLFNVTQKGEIKGLLNFVRDDHRVEAQMITNATNTGRAAHRIVVNIPKPKEKLLYGKELRNLFMSGPGNELTGADADGLEARIEAHFCYPYEGGKEYAYDLIEGDLHSKNALIFEVESRDEAKAPKYALMLAHVKLCEFGETLR